MPKKEIAIKHATILGAYLLIVWGFYRNAARLPETIEELVIKPVLWLIPVAYLLKKEGLGLRSLGVNMQNLFPSVYLAVILGVVFALEGVFVNYVKYDQVEFAANLGEIAFSTLLLLSVVTAVVEELTFRGYLFNRVWHGLGNEWVANFAVSAVWGMIHVPIAVFWWKFDIVSTLVFVTLMFIYGVGASFVFARTKNIISPILLHFLWGWPILLFR